MSETAILKIDGVDNNRVLTALEFQSLAEVPPEVEWFANIQNPNTRRAYRNDVKDFMAFTGIRQPGEFRAVKRAHLIAWRKTLETRKLEAATIRRKLSAVSSLFDFLCEANAVSHNPAADTLKGLRDRATLSALLFQGLRRAELCGLRVCDLQERRGLPHFRVEGKGGKTRFIPVNPHTVQRISDYLAATAHRTDGKAPLFLPVRVKPAEGRLKPMTGNAIYKDVVRKHAGQIGIEPSAICVHGLRATAATNALDHDADIAKVQEWLGHSSIATTRLYDRRDMKPEESPSFKVSY